MTILAHSITSLSDLTSLAVFNPSGPHWSVEAKNNAKTVLEFVQLLMNDHNFEEILQRYSGSPYRQHNRNIAVGIQDVIKTVRDFVKNREDDSQGLNIVDTWKLEDGCLVEH